MYACFAIVCSLTRPLLRQDDARKGAGKRERCDLHQHARLDADKQGAPAVDFYRISSDASLSQQWFGESNKLVAALFSLARKLQPSIIFIDEIDAFLRDRGSGDHEATGMMKAEFMTCVCALFCCRCVC